MEVNRRALIALCFLTISCLVTCGERLPERRGSRVNPQSTISTRVDALTISNNLLNSVPCEMPCWYGIVLGESSVGEAIDRIENSGFFGYISSYKINLRRYSKEGITFGWNIEANDDAEGYDSFLSQDANLLYGESRDGLVDRINVTYPIHRLSELIEAFGQPSHVSASYSDVTERNLISWRADIIWMQKGLLFTVSRLSDVPQDIATDLPLSRAVYFPPSLDGYRQAGFEDSGLRLWDGYSSFYHYATEYESPH